MLSYRAFLLVDCGLHIYYLDQGGFELVCFVCLSVGLLKNYHPAFMKLGGRA